MASFFEIRIPTDFAFAGEIIRVRTRDFTRIDPADLVRPLLLINHLACCEPTSAEPVIRFNLPSISTRLEVWASEKRKAESGRKRVEAVGE